MMSKWTLRALSTPWLILVGSRCKLNNHSWGKMSLNRTNRTSIREEIRGRGSAQCSNALSITLMSCAQKQRHATGSSW